MSATDLVVVVQHQQHHDGGIKEKYTSTPFVFRQTRLNSIKSRLSRRSPTSQPSSSTTPPSPQQPQLFLYINCNTSNEQSAVIPIDVPQQSPSSSSSPTTTTENEIQLTPEQLASMRLHSGWNHGSLADAEGQEIASFGVFLFRPTAKLIVSDIDGTITKSDARGHLLGKHWVQPGVRELFHELHHTRGYQFVYLSARPLSSAPSTRTMLYEDLQLPMGPVIVSPDSSIKSLVREFAQKDRLMQFKANCLAQVASLFPAGEECCWGGAFGNRVTDIKCYTEAGVPLKSTVLVDASGCCQTQDSQWVFQSYLHMSQTAFTLNQLFPSLLPDSSSSSPTSLVMT